MDGGILYESIQNGKNCELSISKKRVQRGKQCVKQFVVSVCLLLLKGSLYMLCNTIQ